MKYILFYENKRYPFSVFLTESSPHIPLIFLIPQVLCLVSVFHSPQAVLSTLTFVPFTYKLIIPKSMSPVSTSLLSSRLNVQISTEVTYARILPSHYAISCITNFPLLKKILPLIACVSPATTPFLSSSLCSETSHFLCLLVKSEVFIPITFF